MTIPSPNSSWQGQISRIPRTIFITLLTINILSACIIILAARFGAFRSTSLSLYLYVNPSMSAALHSCMANSSVGLVVIWLSSQKLRHRYRYMAVLSFLITTLALS